MKVAVLVFGSVGSTIKDIEKYLPENTTGIEIEGSMNGVLRCASDYAQKHLIPYGETYPNYNKYGDNAPKRSIADIIMSVDLVIAFWDGESCDIIFVQKFSEFVCVPFKVYKI